MLIHSLESAFGLVSGVVIHCEIDIWTFSKVICFIDPTWLRNNANMCVSSWDHRKVGGDLMSQFAAFLL